MIGGRVSAADVSRDDARRAAEKELSREEYAAEQPGLLERGLEWVFRRLGELLDGISSVTPGGNAGLVLVLLLLALLAAVLVARVRPVRRGAAPGAVFAGAAELTAAQHRDRAEQAAAEARWSDAVRERMRAIVRELEDRGVLNPAPGRTAGEVARDGGQGVPALAEDLARAARTFDEVSYGGRPGTAASYAVLVEVDAAVTNRRLALS